MNTESQFPALSGPTALPAMQPPPRTNPPAKSGPDTPAPAQRHPLGPIGHKHPLTGKRC